MKIMITRNHRGFTLIEIVVVLVLISIVAATVFTRSITTDQINISAQTEKIKSHIRYAQSLAMKRNQRWGIFCGGNEYWLFGPWSSIGNEFNPVQIPGQDAAKISLPDLSIDLSPDFIIYFDGYGKPFQLNPFPRELLANKQITVKSSLDDTQSRTFNITAETGLITTP
jgi:MSHA pilin protein MshC